MPCINCKDSRHTCGSTLSSACIWFTGEFQDFVPDDERCKPNLNDILKVHGENIDTLVKQTDVKTLDKKSLGYDVNSITLISLLQLYNTEISNLKQKVSDLQSIIDNFDIGSKTLVIDLKCLSPDISACATNTNTYTLQSILNTLVSQDCK